MPFFKSTYNILKTPWEDEVFEPKWFESNKLILPPGGPDDPKHKWDYKRPMVIEDVDIWEQIYYQGGGLGLYAAWCPYAEFYMITHHLVLYKKNAVETYYGPGAEEEAYKRALQLGMPIRKNQVWVEDDELWLHQKQHHQQKIFI